MYERIVTKKMENTRYMRIYAKKTIEEKNLVNDLREQPIGILFHVEDEHPCDGPRSGARNSSGRHTRSHGSLTLNPISPRNKKPCRKRAVLQSDLIGRRRAEEICEVDRNDKDRPSPE